MMKASEVNENTNWKHIDGISNLENEQTLGMIRNMNLCKKRQECNSPRIFLEKYKNECTLFFTFVLANYIIAQGLQPFQHLHQNSKLTRSQIYP